MAKKLDVLVAVVLVLWCMGVGKSRGIPYEGRYLISECQVAFRSANWIVMVWGLAAVTVLVSVVLIRKYAMADTRYQRERAESGVPPGGGGGWAWAAVWMTALSYCVLRMFGVPPFLALTIATTLTGAVELHVAL